MIEIKDMPKLYSPFTRNKESNWKVINEIPDNMQWVFNDENVKAVEKLDGTNISVLIQNGVVTGIWNRDHRVHFFSKGNEHIMEGLTNSTKYLEMLPDGQHFGELIGPKVLSNKYNLDKHKWIPFSYVNEKYQYKSWNEHPKTFDIISEWFKTLMPLFCLKNGLNSDYVEGVIFVHPDGRMAKLRKNMFDWYKNKR